MSPHSPLLIRDVELDDGWPADVLLRDGIVARIGRGLVADDARLIEGAGARLLPGLHDHHVHLASAAAARASVSCGPPEVEGRTALAQALAAVGGSGWLRGVGYHDSVAGMLDRRDLDAMVTDRPLRIQHRTGRMWFFNSAGLDALLATGLTPPPGLERGPGGWTGRLFDEDRWLRAALAGVPPDLAPIGRDLARRGVTGVTDMSPANGAEEAAFFAEAHRTGALVQRVTVAGRLDLCDRPLDPAVMRGPFKLHLHEQHLPDWDATVAGLRRAHDRARAVAIHCVTETELVFALALLREAGARRGDRIEHASVVPGPLIADMAELGLTVVAQPHFVFERGDAYRRDLAPAEWPWLYRLESLRAAGIVLAGGSDGPFGTLDPWAAMAAATSRLTRGGQVFGGDEALSPEAALRLYLADPQSLDLTRTVACGAAADLCLLDRPWAQARNALSAGPVRMTIVGGRIVHDRIDQPPI